MNTEALFLFLILLLGLVLCSFLGGTCDKEGMTNNSSNNSNSYKFNNSGNNSTNSSGSSNTSRFNNSGNSSGNSYNTNSGNSSGNSFDNYNHFSGSSTSLINGSIFYGPNGGSVVVSTDSNGKQTLKIKLSTGENEMTFNSSETTSSPSSFKPKSEGYTNYYGNNGSATTFYGPNNASATVVTGNDGQQAINVQTSNGSYTFTQSGSTYNPNNTSSTQYYGSTGSPIQTGSSTTSYTGAYGGSAGSVTGPGGNTAYYAQGPGGNTVAGTTNNYNSYDPYYNGTSSTQYYGPNGGSATSVNGAYGGSAGSVTGPGGNTAYYAQGPGGNTVAGTSSNGYDYSSSLPPGVPRSQIPPGQEDLYILKSEVVPPVCPVCPVGAACPRQEPCPACPPCGRCPEPSFECKKVPNYSAIDNNFLPQPVISDFSSFGM